ncbi:MAG: WecB/TagA/CpsF family glycosyltransferase [Candidatus Omnitrophota bacterium]|nr:WecB/TagA/CpsF family glycosyltransferase [Candidatus Omnitrophota bacterium]
MTENSKIKRIFISGTGIDNITFENVVKKVKNAVEYGNLLHIVTPNVDHIIKLQYDSEFKKVYENASLVLADGMPLLWAARFLGTPLKEKISGSDLFLRLCALAAEKKYKLFFLGGRPGSALKTAEVLKSKYPEIRIADVYSPPFGFEKAEGENRKIIKMIKDAKPDILFVGLGMPKQEKWISKYHGEYQAPVSTGIGAGFEFVSGVVKRAPVWMQKTGFEWLWRLMMEPRRLWKRYIIDDMKFFWLVFKQKIKQREYSDG